ncbi:YdiU family protein [Pedobacter sp. SYSU D00535]|uniref:protein adenylyltransferase SelO n=1 Tax=Pedobacter sp. SYSU D00535 TaxID=2810308 RepID=UPI001A973D53|nr:YdiU family protein [Pedobacter sp. SYSU D00535]
MQSLTSKIYKNTFTETFEGDETGNLTPRQTPGVLYSKALPSPVAAPRLLAWSDELATTLGVQKPETPEDVAVLAGNYVTPTMHPYAACYAGHQFGHWAGQLGDGRAITLGEWEAPDKRLWEFQLKGAGPTPYSRRADGRAVLRSSLREYLMSEAMHYLGVPTTRALSLVATGDQVMRDMFYDGRPEYEPGAIVMRVAPSFLRFGNFEMLAARQETEHLKQLVDWTISRFYPHIQGENKVLQWFQEVVDRTATLIVEWQRVGFVHGVMNTDNMSILGLTIDYGPFSFVDEYDLNFTPNTTDLPGRRYAFGKQASIAYWNLGCLANALVPLFDGTEELVKAIESFSDTYWERYYLMLASKLGLDHVRPEDIPMFDQLEKFLDTVKPDMTIFFQELIDLAEATEPIAPLAHFSRSFYREPDPVERNILQEFIESYRQRFASNTCSKEESLARMRETSPRFIPRNYLLHQAIEDLQKGDSKLFDRLQEAIKEPYSNKFDEFFLKRPDWASNKAGCSMLSCSS